MAAVMQAPKPGRVHGVKRKNIGRRKVAHTQLQEVIFTKSKGPADFLPPKENRAPALRHSSRIKNQRSKPRRSVSSTDEDDASDLSIQSVSRDIMLPTTIPNSTLLEHVATSRFFHHYLSPSRTFCRLDLDFTSQVIDNAAIRSTLAEAIIALGILTLPRKTPASCHAARLRYTRALRLTNEALQNKNEAKSDEVLMAVILLSCFETTPDDCHSLTSWTAHLDGARMLLRIRGVELLQRGPTYRMFSFMRTQILINCLMTMSTVPQDLIDLSTRLAEIQEGDEKAASELIGYFARMCNLVASSRNPQNLDRASVLAKAEELDEILVTWSATLPPGYEYFSEPAEASANTYSGYYDVYSSMFSVEVWMIYRATRLGVNGLIVEQCSMIDLEQAQIQTPDTHDSPMSNRSSSPAKIELAFSTLESIRADQCASVPYMLGRYGVYSSRRIPDIPLCKRTPVLHMLMFTLKTVGITEDMCSWIMSQVAELQSDQGVDDGAIWNNSTNVWQ